MMPTFKSEEQLKKQLMDEVYITHGLSVDSKQKPQNDVNAFLIDLFVNCRYLYMKRYQSLKLADLFEERENIVIKELDKGWCEVVSPEFHGQFVNANQVLKNAVCNERECHRNSYQFAISANFPVNLITGFYQMFDSKKGFLHSVCEFEHQGREVIFDSAKFLIMDKDLYYKLFNFKEQQVISSEELRNDIIAFTRRSIDKAELKTDTPANLIFNPKLQKRFLGFGFLTYLYNRNDFYANTEKSMKHVKARQRDFDKFNETLKSVEEIINYDDSDESTNCI